MADRNRDNDQSSANSNVSSGRSGPMTVEEAGRKGGQIGGQRVKDLIEEGKQAEGENSRAGNKSSGR
jgi:hypothetical protein